MVLRSKTFNNSAFSIQHSELKIAILLAKVALFQEMKKKGRCILMERIKWHEGAQEVLPILSRGAFLTTIGPNKINVMTIAWGTVGYIWARPIFLILVRPSRFTHQLLLASQEFTVSIPAEEMKEALDICGKMSGRDGDKLAAAGLSVVASQEIATPRLACPGWHYECRVIDQYQMDPGHPNQDIQSVFYPAGDLHTMFFSEIVAQLRIKN